jgi:hypothetical protein
VSFKNNQIPKGKSYSSAAVNAQAFISAQVNIKTFAKSLGKITAEYDKALKGFTVCGVKSELQLNSIRNNSFVAFNRTRSCDSWKHFTHSCESIELGIGSN